MSNSIYDFRTAYPPLAYNFTTATPPPLAYNFRSSLAPIMYDFRTGSAGPVVYDFRTSRPPVAYDFRTETGGGAIVYDFRTAAGPLVHDFKTDDGPGPLTYYVNDSTGLVTVVVTGAITGPYIATVTRVTNDLGGIETLVVTDPAVTTVTFTADAEDEAYFVVVRDGAGSVAASGYAVVLTASRGAFREENRAVAAGGVRGEGVAPHPRWLHLYARMRGVLALATANDSANMKAQLLALRKLGKYDHQHLGGIW